MFKEIIPKKYRWFIWAIVIIVVVGASLLAYVYITGLNIESETPIIGGIISQKGTIDVLSDPEGAKIFLDDKDTGKVTNDILKVKKGKHTVKLTKEGYKDYVEEVEVKKGDIFYITAILEEGEGTTDPTADWESYTNEEYGYEVKHPNDWKVTFDKSTAKATLTYLDPSQITPHPPALNIEIRVQDNPNNWTVDQWIANDERLPILNREDTSVGGVKGTKVEFKGMGTVETIFLLKDNRLFTISRQTEGFDNEWNLLLSTFKFTD